MTTIAILGVTGFAGGHIATEALDRGIDVLGVARKPSPDTPAAVEFRAGSLDDGQLLDELAAAADVLVVATVSHVDGRPWLAEQIPALLAACGRHGARLGVVGGAGSLEVAPGGPALFDTPEFPDAYKPSSKSHGRVLAALREARTDVDWFYLSPAAEFGAHSPGERTGSFRLGGDLLLSDAQGVSAIGGADYAIAFVDEIEKPAHHQERFTVAY